MEEDDQPKESLPRLLHTLLSLTSHKSWYVKLEAASALAVFQVCRQSVQYFHDVSVHVCLPTAFIIVHIQAQHRALLMPAEGEAVLGGLINLLGDDRREVQDAARSSLSSFLSSSELSLVGALAQRHAEAALEVSGRGGKGKRRKDNKGRPKPVTEGTTSVAGAGGTSAAEGEEESKAKARTLQTSALCLASLVLAYPYEVPPFLPRALTVLAKLCDGPATLQV